MQRVLSEIFWGSLLVLSLNLAPACATVPKIEGTSVQIEMVNQNGKTILRFKTDTSIIMEMEVPNEEVPSGSETTQ